MFTKAELSNTVENIEKFMIAFGFVVANVCAALLANIDPYNVGWRLMFALACIPAALQFVGFIFLPDTPRYLVSRGKEREAEEVLNKIYAANQDWVRYELEEMEEFKRIEEENKALYGNSWIILRVLSTSHVRKALFLGCSMQMFQQLVGINTILYYTGTIIQSAGVQDKITTIWISSAISSVQAFGTFAPMKLIEKMGRRPILLISMVGVVLSLCMMGGAFLLINKDSAPIDPNLGYNGIHWNSGDNNKTIMKCASYSNCDYCVTSSLCGFCHLTSNPRTGQCLPIPKNIDSTHPTSTVGFCDGRNSNYTLAPDYCSTKYTAAPIVVMVIYLIFYSFGMGPMPWVFNSEIYPLWARGTCVSLSTFTNWIFNLAISLTFLSLGEAIHKYGAFFLYAGISTLGLILFYFFIPETKGLIIEEVELLFMAPSERKKRRTAFEMEANGIKHQTEMSDSLE